MERYLPKEKENRKIGAGISIGVHLIVLLLFIFLAAWRAPYPPNPGIPGVELNFGIADAGMGEVQSETKTNNTEEAKSEEVASVEPNVEEVAVQNTPKVEVEKTAEVKEEAIQTAPLESPHTVPDQSDLSTKTAKEDTKVAEKSQPQEQHNASTGTKGKEGEKNIAGSDGDKNVPGDQGNSKGKLDARAYYGNEGTGGGGGPKLDMAGWIWDDKPDKVDPSPETGYVVFEFKVDDYGNIEWVKTKEVTVSPSVEKFYKQQLEKITFSRTGSHVSNYIGRVRFEVKAH